MTRIRIGESLYLIPDEQWEPWVRAGRVPPDAWVHSPYWTQGTWRQADSLEVYHLFIPTPPRPTLPPAPPLGSTIFPRRGLSVTEGLALLNILVTVVLTILWRDDYSERLWWFSRFMRRFLGDGRGFFVTIVPMFLHAGAKHLFFNMIALFASGAVVEYFYGKWKMIVSYLLSGFGGAAVSLALRDKPLLSVGASGAIFGLYGLSLLFILRHFRKFNQRQRWKAIRVYLPIVVLAVIPSIFGGDFYTHLGGFLTGCAIGVFLPPGPRIDVLRRPSPIDAPEPSGGEGPAS